MSDPLTPAPAMQGLIARIQSILLKPQAAWDVIDAEPSTIRSIFTGYVVPLAAIGPVCGAIGMSLIGVGMPGLFSFHTPWLWSIASAIVMYVCALIGVYVEAMIIDALAPSFDGQKNLTQAYKVAAYSATAAWLCGVFRIIPALGFLGILGLYSLYLLYLGLPKLMKAPQEKSLGYTIVVVIVTCVLYVIIFAIGGAVAGIGAVGAMMPGHMAGNTTMGTVSVGGNSINLDQAAVAASAMAAQASAVQNGTAAETKMVNPQALLDLMPPIFNGVARSDTSTSSGGVNGASASNAEATYVLGTGTVHLKVSDIGGVAGVGGFLNAINVNSSSSSAGGYETIQTQGNRKITEHFETDSKHGSYGILQDGRFAVSAEGDNVDMNTLKTLVATVDLGKAASLAH